MDNYIIEIIENTKRNNSIELNLQNKKLIGFPQMVCQLPQLKELILGSYNVVEHYNVTYDEDYWWEVTADDNLISILPEKISLLKNLEILDLNQIGLGKVAESIGELSNLKILKLRNNFLHKLPNSLSKLQNLEVLDISYNAFKYIPEVIFECKKLKELRIGANRIKIIPNRISELQNLEILDFSNFNQKKVWELVEEEFDLNINSISNLPVSIRNMANLKSIIYNYNPLELSLKYYLTNIFPSQGIEFWFENPDKFRTLWENEPEDPCMT